MRSGNLDKLNVQMQLKLTRRVTRLIVMAGQLFHMLHRTPRDVEIDLDRIQIKIGTTYPTCTHEFLMRCVLVHLSVRQ